MTELINLISIIKSGVNRFGKVLINIILFYVVYLSRYIILLCPSYLLLLSSFVGAA